MVMKCDEKGALEPLFDLAVAGSLFGFCSILLPGM
jgi:hypothetical protein